MVVERLVGWFSLVMVVGWSDESHGCKAFVCGHR